MAEQLLFAGNSVGDVLRAHHERLRSFVQDIDPDVVLSTPTEDLLDRICAKFEIECPVLRHDERYSPGAKDVKFDVTGDFRRATFGPGPHHVPGTSVSVHVPFDGEKDVFLLRPNPVSMSPPRAVISGQEVIVTVGGPADSLNPDALRKRLEETISQIQIHLDRARTEIGPYNDGLRIRHKDVTGIGEKAVAELRSHLRFKRQAPDAGTLPVFALHHDGDEAREIEIALVPVPIPG